MRCNRYIGALVLAMVMMTIGTGGVGCGEHKPRSFSTHWASGFKVIAHRGGAAAAPENTLAAFQKAVRLKVAIELDVMFCKTGELVVIHDTTVDRTTNGSGLVAEMTLAQLKKLDAGSYFSNNFAGEKIPTLAEVLDAVGQKVKINIEVKHEGTNEDAQKLSRAIAALLAAKNMTDRIIISSFNPYVLEAFATIAPQIPRAQLYSDFADTDLPFHKKVVLSNRLLNEQAKPDFLAPHQRLVNKAFIKKHQSQGYRIYVYTVNNLKRMQQLYRDGVDGIITDDPAVALKVLAEGS